jgi:hypothetical protein
MADRPRDRPKPDADHAGGRQPAAAGHQRDRPGAPAPLAGIEGECAGKRQEGEQARRRQA